MIDKLGVKSYIFIQTVKPLKSLLTKTCHSSLGSREEVRHQSRIWETDHRKRRIQTAFHTRPIHSIETFFKEMAQSHRFYIHRASDVFCTLPIHSTMRHIYIRDRTSKTKSHHILSLDRYSPKDTYLPLSIHNTTGRKHENTKTRSPRPPPPPPGRINASVQQRRKEASERAVSNPWVSSCPVHRPFPHTRQRGEKGRGTRLDSTPTPRSRVDGAGI